MHMEIQQTDQFRKWLHRLRDHAAKARITARIRQCYRVYFAQKGNQIMLLLAGGDKTGQDKAIKEAQEMLESLIKEGQW